MGNRAKVDQSVFDYLRPQLKKYRLQTDELVRDVSHTIVKVKQQADDIVLERRRRLKRAEDELKQCECQENADCSGYRRQVEQCARQLADAVKGRQLIEEASSRFRHAQAKHAARVEQLLADGQKFVGAASERTAAYQKSTSYVPSTTLLGVAVSSSSPGSWGASTPQASGASINAGGGSSESVVAQLPWQDVPGVSVPERFPRGFALIPPKLIVNDNPVRGLDDFDAGQDAADLRWSADALLDVVLPAMKTVPDARDYLLRRDQSTGLTPPRSYVATYDGFFGSRAIVLSPNTDGTFDLINGRHRLWLLSQAGADGVPARIESRLR